MFFKNWLENEGKREQTIQIYVRSVRQFMEWLHISHGRNWNPDEISAKVIHEWIHHMQTIEKVAKPTIRKSRFTLNGVNFGSFLDKFS